MANSTYWQRAIALVDMNAFFASLEQLDNPKLRGRPIGVTNGLTGTCIITSSYEARAQGIKTGMRLKQARERCPDLIQCPARPQRYAEVSTRIMRALCDITPKVEVFSVDEAFLDITACQKLHGTPEQIGYLVKKTVFESSKVLCSVGISGDKTTAKYAAKLQKPNGLTVIPPWQAAERLAPVPVTDICGISHGIGRFLADHGVHTCGDMTMLPISVLARRFGHPGRRIWYMCQGLDPDTIHLNVPPPKSIGHGKVMPPNTTDRKIIQTFLLHMSAKVAARLRRHHLQASIYSIGLRADNGWIGGKYRLPVPDNDGKQIMALCKRMLNETWSGHGVHQVQITALDPMDSNGQMDLFSEDTSLQDAVNLITDKINQQYGEFSIAPARLLKRSDMPNVIAPAWKPFGHRETIN